MKKNSVRILALFLAVCLVVGAGFLFSGKALKAEEDGAAYEAPAEAAPVEEVKEIVISAELPEPVAEAGEEPAAEPAAAEDPEIKEDPAKPSEEDPEKKEEEPKAESEEEPEEAFDVIKAYREYMALETDAEKEAYLNALSPENREALLQYIKLMEEQAEKEETEEEAEEPAEEEPEVDPVEEQEVDFQVTVKVVNLDGGDFKVGSHVRLLAESVGAPEGATFTYRWQFDAGNGKEDIPGANEDHYDLVLDEVNGRYSWFVVINWTTDKAE